MIKLKVLIIDDEVDYCLIMKGYFTRKNYDVAVAYNLKDGLHKIEAEKPNILFLDNNLPDGQGWSHVEEIVEKNPHLRIYLASAYHQHGDFFSPPIGHRLGETHLNELAQRNFRGKVISRETTYASRYPPGH